MKVTRLKMGYRIVCTDSEFSALRHMLAVGQANALSSDAFAAMPGTAKTALRSERFTQASGPLMVDENRREDAS